MTGHLIVVDLGYGDAGKGTIVDWLVTRAARTEGSQVSTVVRFNGGAQAAHNVIRDDGRWHTFAQFGSGTFTPGTRTFLSRFMLVDPLAMTAEAANLARLGIPDPLGLVTIDADALLTTPYHRAANQAREAARGDGRHGSCGMGIGETARYALDHPEDAPRAGDMTSPRTMVRKLTQLCDRLAEELRDNPPASVDGTLPPPADLAAVYRAVAGRIQLAGDGHLARLLREGPVVFEGAQGVLLDEWRGFHPYTTWSTTTFANAETLLAEAGQTATRLGVTRTYQTRHGPGPFPTQDPALRLPEPHNGNGRWQGPFRVGHLDAVALRYAVAIAGGVAGAGGVDAIALTHLDAARNHPAQLRICRAYDTHGTDTHGSARQHVDRLPLGAYQDLVHQERLTQLLLTARPVYSQVINPEEWPDVVSEIIGAPVALTSHGPATADKTPAGILAAASEPIGSGYA
jgi:adenylosuccinate synthase